MEENENVIEVPKEMGNLTIGEEDPTPTAPAAPATPAPKAEDGPVYLGGKRFESKEDLIAYASELQTKVTKHEVEREYQTPASTAMQNANQPKPGDLLYSDPDAFYQLVKEDAKKEMRGELHQERQQKTTWDNFYSKYPDLKDSDLSPMVEFQFEKRKKELGHLPADQVLDTIGKEVRSIIGKVRGRPEGGKELPSGNAVVASGTNNIPPSKTAVQSEPQDMASQIRRFQKRGR